MNDSPRLGVDVHAAAADEAAERHAAIDGQLDCERRGCADSDEDRAARDGCFLHELEREPAADAEHCSRERQPVFTERPADDLVHRVVTADVLAQAEQAAGGVEEAGRMDAAGSLLCLREDVGRHNAMDKVVGWAFREGRLPLDSAVLCVSGRLSFELVQKAAVAGCPILVAVGAPSSLAVELAGDRGVTLCGFVRNGRMNVYSEPWRIAR